jgi:hypothetical protein
MPAYSWVLVMSRIENDAYYTPLEVARKCRDALDTVLCIRSMKSILEPSVGTGAFLQVIKPHLLSTTSVHGADINPHAEGFEYCDTVFPGDFLTNAFPDKFDLVIGNPPYKDAVSHVRKALACGNNVAFLLQLSFLASHKRKDFWEEHPPSHLFILTQRPKFMSKGSAFVEYGFFVWLEHVWKVDKYPQIHWI